MDFTVLADYEVKIKENKRIDKYFEPDRELNKMWKFAWNDTQMSRLETGGTGNQIKN